MANSSAMKAIYDAVYARISTDTTLLGLADSTILGYEPEEPPTNFIVLGSGSEEAWHTLGGTATGFGWSCTVTVHLYSYYKGDLKVLQMLERVVALLNFHALSVAGYTSGTVICEYGEKMSKVLIETKDKRERRHIPAVFSVRVHE